jgi:hypothetical protein
MYTLTQRYAGTLPDRGVAAGTALVKRLVTLRNPERRL